VGFGRWGRHVLHTHNVNERNTDHPVIYTRPIGPLPFAANIVTEFIVQPRAEGAQLQVQQVGFPLRPEADAFYAACKEGWSNSFAGIRRYLGGT